MTCIAGVVYNGKAYIGGDSCGSDGYSHGIINHPKVFRVGEFVIGGTTSFRMLDLLEYSFTPPEIEPEEDMDRYMRTKFVTAVKECMVNHCFAKKVNEVITTGTFLVAFGDKIWEVQDDLSVLNRPSWGAACGSGTLVALGSLITTSQNKNYVANPEKRITMALQAAEEIITTVRGPFHIISTGGIE